MQEGEVGLSALVALAGPASHRAPGSLVPRVSSRRALLGPSCGKLPLPSLTRGMIHLGVTTQRTYAVKCIDSEFFGEE